MTKKELIELLNEKVPDDGIVIKAPSCDQDSPTDINDVTAIPWCVDGESVVAWAIW